MHDTEGAVIGALQRKQHLIDCGSYLLMIIRARIPWIRSEYD
jgi:hypothetical protein